MDVHVTRRGQAFVWDSDKAATNYAKHGMTFEDACSVFFDFGLLLWDASVDDERRDGKGGHMKTMPEKIRGRMRKDRPMATISIRMPEDLIDDLEEMAALLGFSGYQSLIRSYIGQGMRKDEAMMHEPDLPLLREVLKNRFMSEGEIEAVTAEVTSAGSLQKRA